MVVVVVIGPTLITTIYGQKFSEAGHILRIHVLALPFVFMAAVFSKWILTEHLLWASLRRHALAAALNVVLNLVLVPKMGLEGAAISTVVSYSFGSFWSCFIGRRTRPAGVQMALALVWPARIVLARVRTT
jgi:O-antigen/teichoic acid export membrane protein